MIRTAQAARPGHPALNVTMTIARELGELATAAVMGPSICTEFARRALRPPQIVRGRRADASGRRTPVVLVHGYGGNRSNWLALEHRLAHEGFRNVHTHTYNVLSSSVPDIARALVARCEAVAEEAGTEQVDVIGHSLGGVVLRYAVARYGLAPRLSTAVTVAAPHRGTRVALLGPGNVAASLRPGSTLLEDLRRVARDSNLRWVAYWSDGDLVVPPASARLEGDVPGACDVLVPGVGHLGILRSPAFLDSVVGILRDREPATSVPIGRSRAGRQPAAHDAA